MIYRIDFTKLVYQLLPPILRSKILVALFGAMLVPLLYLYDRFLKCKDSTNRTLDITANVEILEKALNDAFYLTDGQIYIIEPEEVSMLCAFLVEEHQEPIYMYNFGREAEHPYFQYSDDGQLEDNFTVYIPSFLCSSLEREEDKYGGIHLRKVIEIVNRYRPAGKKYHIEIYDYE